MSVSPKVKNIVHITGNLDADKTIVFGHGFGTDQSAFQQLMPAYKKDYRIVLYDNIGGGSTQPNLFDPVRYNSLHAYASDLIAVLDEAQLKDVIFVGHSASGMIGLLASIKRPELFSKLILLAASARYLNDDAAGYIGGFSQTALDDLYVMMKNNYQAWASGFAALAMANPENPELAAQFAGSLNALRPDIALMAAKVIFQSDYRDQLEKVSVPVLIIQSNDDIAVPLQASEYLHKNIKESKYLVVHATGHLPHVSAPEEIINAINSFI